MSNIKDVAALAGVSMSTVSIILNGKSEERKISQETQEKVAKAIKKLNYQPNLSAKRLRSSNNKKIIALFWTTDFREVMLARFMSGLHQQIRQLELNYDIVIYPYENNKLYKEKSLQGSANFHGAIIANASEKDLEYLHTFQPLIPIVLYNRELENYSGIVIDNEVIGKQAAHLCKTMKNVGIIKVPYVFEGMKIRDDSFLSQIKEYGINSKIYEINKNSIDDAYKIAKNIDFQTLDALFLPSDHTAYGIMHYCYQNCIQIPEDISLIAIGNGLTQYAKYSNPSLTVIEIPMEEMASKCLTIINQLFKDSTLIKEKINPSIIIRDSLKEGK